MGEKMTLPPGFVLDTLPQGFTLDQEEESIIPSFISGEGREAEETKGLPELQNSGILAGEDILKGAAVTPALLSATDPNEIASIISSNFPNVRVTYNKGEEGNVYPVLVNNKTGAATVINRPGISGLDVMQGLGLAAAYTPAGATSGAISAGLKAGGTGALIEGAQEVSGGEFNPENVLMDALFGAGGKTIENALSGFFRVAKGKPAKDVDELLSFAKEQDLPLSTTDVVPPETFTGKASQALAEKIPLTGTGKMQANKQNAREALLESISKKYGAPSESEVFQSFMDKRQLAKSAASKRYQDINNQMGSQPVAISKTLNSLDDAMDSLTKKGSIKDPETLRELFNVRQALEEAPQTFESLKQNRTLFREMVRGDRVNFPDSAKRMVDKVYKDMTDNLRLEVKKRLGQRESARWVKANQYIFDEAQTLKNSRLKNVLNKGEVTPEVAQQIIFSKNPSEVKALYSRLDQRGRDAGRAAIISKALETANNSPDRFLNNMSKLNKQTGVFFRGEEKKFIKGVQKYLEATREAGRAAVTTKSGQELLQPALYSAAAADVIQTGGIGTMGALTYGLMGRVYESKPARNLLATLAATPKGTVKYDKVLAELGPYINGLAQSQQRQQQ